MPSSYDINQMRAGAPDRFRAAPMPAHDKENSFAPAMVSQEETRSGAARRRNVGFYDDGAGCRGSSSTE